MTVIKNADKNIHLFLTEYPDHVCIKGFKRNARGESQYFAKANIFDLTFEEVSQTSSRFTKTDDAFIIFFSTQSLNEMFKDYELIMAVSRSGHTRSYEKVRNKKYHQDSDKPSRITYDSHQNKIHEEYYHKGKLHRDPELGPAQISYERNCTSRIISSETHKFFVKGENIKTQTYVANGSDMYLNQEQFFKNYPSHPWRVLHNESGRASIWYDNKKNIIDQIYAIEGETFGRGIEIPPDQILTYYQNSKILQ